MAKDPMFSNRTSPNGATAPNDPLNDSHKRYYRGYNKFNLTRQFYNTERYADINLVEVLEGVEGDTLPFGNKHYLRSYTLKSPMMFDIYKKKTYFAVNNQAILPINWKKVYKQPNKGDDVSVDVNCVSTFLKQIANSFIRFQSWDVTYSNSSNYEYLWRYILLLESIFSNGSLLSSMNCHLSNLIKVTDGSSFDEWLEQTYSYFIGSATDYIDNVNAFIPSLGISFRTGPITADSQIRVSLRVFLDLLRTFSDFQITFTVGDTQDTRFLYLLNRIKMLRFSYNDDTPAYEDSQYELNLSRLIAYQLVCVQFYTRDSVDNIYTAPDFIDNAKSEVIRVLSEVVTGGASSSAWPQFAYNGTYYDYDVFSGKVIDALASYFFNQYPAGNNAQIDFMRSCYNYFHMIFFYRKSLRYGDYFSGAKTLPYAPMDVTADVVGNGVSALDMTRSIIAQRFANLVERVSNTWNDYLAKVTGGKASPTPFEPRFLANSTSSVNGFEVENTGSEQFSNQNVSTLLKSGNSNYIYEVEVNEPMIIIGVSTYEVPRVYSATVSRFFKHTDRFNMFNKSFQNIGDQEITQNERNSAFSPYVPFGYTPRHMEYKQRYPIASGGFVDHLPGYAFITDNNESNQNEIDLGDGFKISSYYLRNRNSEFDRFYSNLTGLTLASYFHFIVKYDLICHARRQMEYAPDIL